MKLDTFEDFDRALQEARMELEQMLGAEPDDGAIQSVHRQLEALHVWTRGGKCPDQRQKDSLNFGLIASRELDAYPVSDALYDLASFVTWWGHKRPC